ALKRYRRAIRYVTQTQSPGLMSWPFAGAVVVLGVACGLGGAGFTLLLSLVEQAAFGFTTGTVAEAATQAQALRRFLVVVSAGCLVAVAWWALRKYGPKIPSVTDAARGKNMPPGWTVADTVLQVVNVGAGGSIGREGAPRQFGAMAAGFGSRFFGLSPEQRLALVACGAGAGLAGIYNVPLGGAFFAVECVWGLTRLKDGLARVAVMTLAALATSYLATAVAWIAVPDRPIYPIPAWEADYATMAFALVCGPLFGLAGFGFGRLFDVLARIAPKGNAILWTMPLSYLALACIAIPLPLVLGNGHALSLQVFAQNVSLDAAVLLVIAKPVATFLTVGSGATGGKLTPSLSTGTVLGVVLAAAWGTLWPVSPIGAAVVGAAAMLAAAIAAPFTAFVLLVEFTASQAASWPAIALAIFGATLTAHFMSRALPASGDTTH
ncbi:MAG TPA: chloride channel protein, partial [Xanthobacteraceae bacterium]|nr:chloride channel protein [Xanthobacteraceae bacterium]